MFVTCLKMPNKKRSIKKEICEGCLSKGRKLMPITKYLRLYLQLMEGFLEKGTLYKTNMSKVPLMCWECQSHLKNAENFRKRVKQAYEALLKDTNLDTEICNQTLSKLTSVMIPTYDYELKYEETAQKEYSIHEIKKVDEKPKLKVFEVFPTDEITSIIKEEYTEIKLEDPDYVYVDDLDHIAQADDDEENFEKVTEAVKQELSLDNVMETNKKKRKLPRFKFRVIQYEDDNHTFDKMCLVQKIDREELERCREKARQREKYVKATMKCEKCITGFFNEKIYQKHLKKYHSKSKKFVCTICGIRIATKSALSTHMNSHDYKYICLLCDFECLKRQQVCFHLACTHQKAVECKECGMRLNYKEFYQHYNSLHTTYICDYCGYKSGKKHRLANHIRVNHGDNICQFCNKKYVKYHSMVRHIELRHTKEATEDAYCVECNIQFDNLMLYQRHLKESVKHKRKKSYPCPECKKVYAKNIAMKNHYNYIHLQKTKFVCDQCSRYFLNGFRLRTHIASFHNKIQPPRNKICPHCGRGFRTNRILDNHVRTHTGERPFACGHCSATFAQKSALVSHTRSIHKIMMSYANTA